MKCISVAKFDSIDGDDILRVRFSDDTEAFWCYNYADALEYVNQEVEYTTRKEIYKGNVMKFINHMTKPNVVNVIATEEIIKLYSDSVDNFSNFSIRDLSEGELLPGAIMYVVSQSYQSSARATWVEFVIRDRNLHTAKLRLFDYDSDTVDYTGRYIMAGINKSKYGLQTDAVYPVDGEVPENPEVTIAEHYVTSIVSSKPYGDILLNTMQYIPCLKDSIDYEKSYALVRLANELAIASNLVNVSNAVNVDTVIDIIIASFLYYTKPQSAMSRSFLNCFQAQRIKWNSTKTVLLSLDEANENKPDEYYVVASIKNTVETLFKIKKGEGYENENV